MIQTKDKIDFSVDGNFLVGVQKDNGILKTIFRNLHGTLFEDFIATTFQDIYKLIIIICITYEGLYV